MTHRPDVDHVLESIDNVLAHDRSMPDAMRWAPDKPDPTPPGMTPAQELAWFTPPRTCDCIYCFVEHEFPDAIRAVAEQIEADYRPEADTLTWSVLVSGGGEITVDVNPALWTPCQLRRLYARLFRGRLRPRYTKGPLATPKPLAAGMGHEYHRRRRARARRRR